VRLASRHIAAPNPLPSQAWSTANLSPSLQQRSSGPSCGLPAATSAGPPRARAGGRADPKTRVPGWDSVKSACIFPLLGVASAWAAFVVQYVRQHAVLRRQRAG